MDWLLFVELAVIVGLAYCVYKLRCVHNQNLREICRLGAELEHAHSRIAGYQLENSNRIIRAQNNLPGSARARHEADVEWARGYRGPDIEAERWLARVEQEAALLGNPAEGTTRVRFRQERRPRFSGTEREDL